MPRSATIANTAGGDSALRLILRTTQEPATPNHFLPVAFYGHARARTQNEPANSSRTRQKKSEEYDLRVPVPVSFVSRFRSLACSRVSRCSCISIRVNSMPGNSSTDADQKCRVGQHKAVSGTCPRYLKTSSERQPAACGKNKKQPERSEDR